MDVGNTVVSIGTALRLKIGVSFNLCQSATHNGPQMVYNPNESYHCHI